LLSQTDEYINQVTWGRFLKQNFKNLSIYFSPVHTMTMQIKLWQQYCNV
jgi:hypothetical protein